MKHFYLLLLISILPAVCFSQSNYVPGSITTNDGETVTGYINYSKSTETPLFVQFKTDASGQLKIYSPLQLKAFQVSGKANYISFRGNISMDKNHFPDIAPALDTTTLQTIVFLKIVYPGTNITLFSQTDKIKTRYFFAEKNGIPQELKYYYYFDTRENTDRQIFAYKGQLIILAQKYNNADGRMMRKLDGLPFEADYLKDVARLLDR
jgi:hypothetical protein